MVYLMDLLTFLENRLQIVNNELLLPIKGSLLRSQRNGKRMYQRDYIENGRRKRETITEESQILKNLARKEYLRNEEKLLRENLRLLNMIKDKYVEIEPANIISMMRSSYKELPAEYFFSTEAASVWEKASFEQSTLRQQNRKHVTSRGLKVRSKSEMLIAERLYANNIPFRYEELLRIGVKTYAPDFTIMKKDGNIIYWEHCGMPNDKGYMIRHKEKMEDYESIGIVPWRNLIVTYEEEGTFNLGIIDSEIRNKLITYI